jgi:general secretion pathway protein E
MIDSILQSHSLDFSAIKFADASKRRVACFKSNTTQNEFALAMTKPHDQGLRQWCYLRQPLATANIIEVSDATLDLLLKNWEKTQSAVDSISQLSNVNNQDNATATELSIASVDSESNAVIKFVSATLVDALRKGASDIHYEATPSELVVRYRIDGVLTQVATLPSKEESDRVISRIKVLSNLDIAEKRIPQDGRLEVSFQNRKIDVRVSVMPSIHGEDIVLRILDRNASQGLKPALQLEDLGLPTTIVDSLISLCKKSHGMVLVTGPTGSGKTTTLYAALTSTYDPGEKVVTIEDPVEYQLSGILQVPVNEKKGLTFARGLRSILRHDPDRILVGEIRDHETAKIAVQASLTGHNVYSTVHANDAIDVLARFRQLGVEDFEISSALNGILSQRLVRLLCKKCAQPARLENDELKAFVSRSSKASTPMQSKGCEYCNQTGFSGRQLIAELILITPEFRQKLIEGGSNLDLAEISTNQGTRRLREQALELVWFGKTTIEEINRVTQP